MIGKTVSHYKIFEKLGEGSAQSALRKIGGMSDARYVPPFQVGTLYLVLEERDSGFRLLNKAFSERDVWMRALKARQPPFPESVRADRRMTELLEKMRFKA